MTTGWDEHPVRGMTTVARQRRMRRLVGVLLLLLLLATVSSAQASSSTTFDRNGIKATLPSGWWASDRRMSNTAIEPLFRLTISNRPLVRTAKDEGPCYGGIGRQIQPQSVVAILREAVGSDFKPSRFKKRPERFVLPKRQPGQDNSCLGDHATLISFKDAGRGFYLWIAAGRDAPTARIQQLLTVLNKLSIR